MAAMAVNGSLPEPRDGPPNYPYVSVRITHHEVGGYTVCSTLPGNGRSGLVGSFTLYGVLFFEQDSFPLRTPPISAQTSVLVHHPVARNYHGHRIRRHGPGDGPDRGRATD